MREAAYSDRNGRVRSPSPSPSASTAACVHDPPVVPQPTATYLEQQSLLEYHQRMHEAEAADLAFARKLQESLDQAEVVGTRGRAAQSSGVSRVSNRAATQCGEGTTSATMNADGSSGERSAPAPKSKSNNKSTQKPKPGKSGAKSGQKSQPETVASTTGDNCTGKHLHQASIRSHVRVLGEHERLSQSRIPTPFTELLCQIAIEGGDCHNVPIT